MEQWDTIYKNNASKLIGVCRRYVKDNQLAEDLMHNAFMTAMSKGDTYSGKGLFEGWLRRIAVNTALMYLRKNKNAIISENELVENYSETVQEEECSEETQRNTIDEANFSKEDLLEVIDQLPEHHKTVFNLYVIDGYKHTQIGQMLNISAGTSKSHLARARKKIQQLLFGKAKNKKENENKKGFFFFLFASKENYIDKLYKDAFTSFEIQPQGHPHLEGGTQSVNTTQKVSILKKIVGNKTMLISSVGVVLSASILVAVFLYYKKTPFQNKTTIEKTPVIIETPVVTEPPAEVNKTSAEQLIPTESQPLITRPVAAGDSSSTKKDISSPTKKGNKTILPSKPIGIIQKPDSVSVKKPFVVRKTIIQHDTVVQKIPVKK